MHTNKTTLSQEVISESGEFKSDAFSLGHSETYTHE